MGDLSDKNGRLAQAPTVVLSANTSWYLYNFRAGLIGRLQAAGWRVVVLSPADAYSDKLQAMGCQWLPLEMSLRGLSILENFHSLARYVAIYARLRPAVVLHFTIKPVIFGSLAARWLGIRTIDTVTGLGSAFIRQDFLTHLIVAAYRPALRRADRVFFQNSEDLDTFVTKRLVAPHQVERVPGSGVDLERFSVVPQPENTRFTFLFIGRLLLEKGLKELIEAARRLSSERIRLVVVGPYVSDADGGVSRADLEAWRAGNLIEYQGALADVRPLIAAADCVVLPSYREGAPRVLLESGAMGRPVIATDVPGCRDVVEDGETGLLCRPRDPSDLAKRMQQMAAMSRPDREAMGLKARKRVEMLFDERLVIEAYLKALGQPRPSLRHQGSDRALGGRE